MQRLCVSVRLRAPDRNLNRAHPALFRERLAKNGGSPKISVMGNRVFEQSIVIREEHLDTFGHVNNARYLEIFEQARWDLITDNGFGLDHVKSTGTGPVILEINLRFLREIKNREHLLIQSFVDSYEGKIGRMTQLLVNDSAQICCEGNSCSRNGTRAAGRSSPQRPSGARLSAWSEALRPARFAAATHSLANPAGLRT